MSDTETPLACKLSATSYGERLKTIGTLFARSLRSSRRDGRNLQLSFAPEAKAEVEDLVRKEEACCAFLTFDLKATAEAVHLTISAPERVADGAENLFAPFMPKA